MKTNKNLIIIILLLVVTFMGIGYAALSTALTIGGAAKSEGSWDVKITGIEATSIVGTATSQSATVPAENNGTTASFAATLNKPGDSVEYTVTVTNNGTITATLATLTPSITLNESHNGVIYTVTGIAEGDNLLKKSTTATSKTFTVKAEFDPSATAIPTGDTEIEFSLTLLYNQCSANCTTP